MRSMTKATVAGGTRNVVTMGAPLRSLAPCLGARLSSYYQGKALPKLKVIMLGVGFLLPLLIFLLCVCCVLGCVTWTLNPLSPERAGSSWTGE